MEMNAKREEELTVEDRKKIEALEAAFIEALDDDGIFTSDEAAEGLKQAAEALGVDPDSVDIKKPRNVLYARKNCKTCFGRGVVTFLPSPAKPKKLLVEPSNEFKASQRKRRRTKVNGKMKNFPTPKRVRNTTQLEGNKLGEVWETCRPEPMSLKVELLQNRPCKCVRILEM